MTTLLYGSIIQIRSTETVYDEKLFFVISLDDDELVLKSNDGNIIILPIEDGSLDSSITEIIILYKPTQGYCAQNKLYPLQWVEIEFEDQTVKGQIIRADTIIEVKLKDESIYIPVLRGLSQNIKITRISKPLIIEKPEAEIDAEIETISPEEGGILGYIEDEDEQEMVQYFYSIEQQTSDLLEHLLMYISEEDRPKIMKKMYKTIQRYKELRSKYTNFTNKIHINKLPKDQIFENILAMKNKYFIPVTKNIDVQHFDSNDAPDKADFFINSSPDWIEPISELLNKEGKFEDKRKAFDEFVQNYIFHSKMNPRRLQFTPPNTQQVYLYDAPPNLLLPKNRYDIRVDKPFVIHSIMTPPTDYLKYSKIFDLGSSILNKSNLRQTPYYSCLYKGKQVSIKDNEVADLFLNNEYVYYENHSEIYNSYIKKMTPSLKNWIEIGLDGELIEPFYNFYQSIKELETVNVAEFNSADYLIVEAFIKIAVKRFSRIKINMSEKQEYKFVEQPFTSRLSLLYKELMPKDLQTVYFSSSELFKIGEMDSFRYYKENYVKDLTILDVTDGEMKGMLDEIKARSQEQVEEKIAKVYKTEEERMGDKTHLKDMNGISGLEHIYQRLIESRRKITQERLKTMIDMIIFNGYKPTPKMPAELATEIIRLLTEIRIIEGELAYVKETKKKYVWNGKLWEDVEANPTCFIKKKLYTGTCETLEKETEYKERIIRLVKEIEQEKRREKELKGVNSEMAIQSSKALLFGLNSKKMKHDLKYNEEKRIYSVLESQKDSLGLNESPYFSLRDRILSEGDIIFKYKAIQIFIKKYTKIGEDPNWYYCIETGIKLLPVFFHKLADAFLVTQNFDKVVERICLEQGTISDDGDKWVDKSSGYIIKSIMFDDDDFGREVLKDEDKLIFDDIVLEELEMERDIVLSLKTLFFYLGVMPEENDLYSLIMKSYKASTVHIADEAQKRGMKLYAIMCHALVYIQTHELKRGKPFPNCKITFEGFPLTDGTNIGGIKYVACVVSKLSKSTPPWNIVSKNTEEQIAKAMAAFLVKFVVPMNEIEELLVKAQTYVEPVLVQTFWDRFSPRLQKIVPVAYQEHDLMSYTDYLYRTYYLSYVIQAIIHKFVSEQELLLSDHSTHYLINSCCDKDNYVYKFFLEKTKMIEPLKEILKLKRRLNVLDSLLLGTKMYFIENTKSVTSEPSTTIDDKNIYIALIQWAYLNPDIFRQFDLPLPRYNKNDNLDRKIAKMKEQGIAITEETFLAMLQRAATIIPRQLPKPEDKLPEDIIVDMLENPDELNNYLDRNIREMISKMGKDPKLAIILNFNKTCKSNKNNLIISDKLEHLSHMNQILYNKIHALLYIFPEMVKSGKSSLDKVVCKHWKLSDVHEKDISDMVSSYYDRFLMITHDERLNTVLEGISLDRYKGLMKINIKKFETQNLLYQYIFVSIFNDYKSNKSASAQLYVKTISQIYEREDNSLNYDTESIEYEIKLSKKSETQIKTDYFKNLSLEDRKSENVLKEHKLDKWGVGLQKGMFQYVKGNYLKDKTNAQAVIDNITKDEDIFEDEEPVVEEDGYDIDEKPEDDDDEEYDEEE